MFIQAILLWRSGRATRSFEVKAGNRRNETQVTCARGASNCKHGCVKFTNVAQPQARPKARPGSPPGWVQPQQHRPRPRWFAAMGAVIKEPMMNIRINKVATVIIGVVVLLALSAGVTLLVTNHTNAHNAAVQRAAAHAHTLQVVAHAKASAQASAIASANAQASLAEREAKQAQRAARRAASRPVVVQPAPAAAQPASPGLTDCGTGTQGEEVLAGSDTSCPFALTVEADYWSAPGMEFTSYSSVTGQSYSMSAVDAGDTVTVTNSTGALVEFSDGS